MARARALCGSFRVFLFSLLTTLCVHNCSAEPLPVTVKFGFNAPAAGELDPNFLAGLQADFRVDNNLFVALEFDQGVKGDCSAAPGVMVSDNCDATGQAIVVSVIKRDVEHGGIYYGAGLANESVKIRKVATVGGDVYHVAAQPRTTGLMLTAGYSFGKRGFSIEARYVLAGKTSWDPLTTGSMTMGGLSIFTTYRFDIK